MVSLYLIVFSWEGSVNRAKTMAAQWLEIMIDHITSVEGTCPRGVWLDKYQFRSNFLMTGHYFSETILALVYELDN